MGSCRVAPWCIEYRIFLLKDKRRRSGVMDDICRHVALQQEVDVVITLCN